MTETRWLDEHELHAWRGYLTMHARLTARLHRQLNADSGLSLADFDVLVQLTDQPDARLRVGELAEALQWQQSRLSHHLARMRTRGLIDREECPGDARGAFVTLTASGRGAIEQAAPAHVEAVRDLLFDQLTAEQVQSLAAISRQVLTHLEDTA